MCVAITHSSQQKSGEYSREDNSRNWCERKNNLEAISNQFYTVLLMTDECQNEQRCWTQHTLHTHKK